MRHPSFWRFLFRWVFYITSVGVLALTIYTVVILIRADLQSGEAVRLSILWALIGMTWAATGIVSNILTIRAASGLGLQVNSDQLLAPHLTRTSAFIDRTGESQELSATITSNQLTNIYGRKGSGKSHFLSFVADVINGHRKAEYDHNSLNALTKYSALYFDLSEAFGFDEALQQVFHANFPGQHVSWTQFTNTVDSAFGTKPIILVLDNVNAEGIWRELGKALYYYLSQRPTDRIVLGSIQPVRFYNLPVAKMLFDGFDAQAISEFATSKGLNLDGTAIAALKQSSDGLPLFLSLLFTHWDHKIAAPAGTAHGVRELLADTILSRLGDDSKELLVGIALLSVAHPEVSEESLRRLPVAKVNECIEELKAFSLIVRRRRSRQGYVKLHDLVRDAVIEICESELHYTARILAIDAMHREATSESAIYWMFAAPEGFDSPVPRNILQQAIQKAANDKSYPLLTSMALIAESRSGLKKLALEYNDLSNALLYARVSALTGTGEYEKAITELENSGGMILRKLYKEKGLNTAEFELTYLHADLLHLQNRYDESLESFHLLRVLADNPEFAHKAARIEWALGHVLRHQGRDLDASMRHFNAAEAIANEISDMHTRVFATTGVLGIELYLGDITTESQRKLDTLEQLIESDEEYKNFLPKLWKSKAQLEFISGRKQQAMELIHKAINHTLEINDRLLFNYYFERGEFLRLQHNFEEAFEDYFRVLEFGRENGDRNLIANALLGIVEAEIASGELIHHLSEADMRAAVLQARAIAQDADIYVTVRQAESTLLRLENSHGSAARLILF